MELFYQGVGYLRNYLLRRKLTVGMIHLCLLGYATAWGINHDKRQVTTPVPEFNRSPPNLTYFTGELATLYCSVRNLGTKTVTWRRSSDPNPLTIGTYTYVQNDRIHLTHLPEKEEWNLHIKSVQKEDSGVYECSVSSKYRNIRQLVLLLVTDRPHGRRKDIKISGPTYVEKGDSIRLTCNATDESYPSDDLDWFKDGNKVVSDRFKPLTITKYISQASKTIVSELTIEKARMKDAGSYVCRTSDLLITSAIVHVLNAETVNVKRVVPTHSESVGADKSGSQPLQKTLSWFLGIFLFWTNLRVR